MHVHYYPGSYYSPYPFINQSPTVPTVAVFSNNSAVCGQKNRSSNNFSISTGNYTVTAPSGVSFNVYQDKTGKDTLIGNYKNGAATSSKYPYPVPLTSGNQYYVANPSGASAPGFNVGFTATS